MRRSERKITDRAELLALLEKNRVMHLGLIDDGRPYVVPLYFGWAEEADGLALYFHCAPDGRKVECIRKHPGCFITVTAASRIIRGAEACSWTALYESLMMEGEAEILTAEKEKKRGLNAMMRHCGFEGDPAYAKGLLKQTLVCRIRVRSISGKRRN